MNNRLFASNITDDTFDVDYDARAYSINKDYQLHLQDGNSANTVNVKLPESKADRDIVYKSINEWHDCINPSLYV
ncbi:MAG: hypothetical protein EOM35_07705 [Negativicutes bacterium]|nr:hypothetical protein [Negativicutes bacterium]